MYNICVFAGTTEGRAVVEFLRGQNVSVTACVATEYGQTLLSPAENLKISAKRLTQPEMEALFAAEQFDLVIDATHPYAQVVTENIAQACAHTNRQYLRLLRGTSDASENAVFVPDIESAAAFLNRTEGNILLTTGSKELSKYAALTDLAQRVYARVLPTEASLEACRGVGIKPANIIAMQGPFTEEMNIALLHAISARYLVTKDGGDVGGFRAKASAAEKAGAQLIVIGQPAQCEGCSLQQVIDKLCSDFGCIRTPDVTIAGIGPGSISAMTEKVRQAIARADCVIGAQRMLDAISPRHAAYAAITPEAIAQFITTHSEYQCFAVVMSGDTGFFSGTKKLLPLLNHCRVRILPGVSSLAYLCAKLGTDYEDIKVVSLHGRQHDILPDVRANSRVFALVGGKSGIRNLCAALTDAGLGHVQITVGQRLSYPDESITVGTASSLLTGTFDSLSVALIENSTPDAIITHGLPDDAFLRGTGEKGIIPMTKSEVRAVSISKLGLTETAICWDIGAGTGSVAIEMALQARKGHVYAIERSPEAVALLQENQRRFSAENMTVVSGTAPEACASLPAPTHVFIGGNSGSMRQTIAQILQKNPSARIVANAIALETVAELTQCLSAFPFSQTETVLLNVSRDKQAGVYHLMLANNPVYIFTMQGKDIQ